MPKKQIAAFYEERGPRMELEFNYGRGNPYIMTRSELVKRLEEWGPEYVEQRVCRIETAPDGNFQVEVGQRHKEISGSDLPALYISRGKAPPDTLYMSSDKPTAANIENVYFAMKQGQSSPKYTFFYGMPVPAPNLKDMGGNTAHPISNRELKHLC